MGRRNNELLEVSREREWIRRFSMPVRILTIVVCVVMSAEHVQLGRGGSGRVIEQSRWASVEFNSGQSSSEIYMHVHHHTLSPALTRSSVHCALSVGRWPLSAVCCPLSVVQGGNGNINESYDWLLNYDRTLPKPGDTLRGSLNTIPWARS